MPESRSPIIAERTGGFVGKHNDPGGGVGDLVFGGCLLLRRGVGVVESTEDGRRDDIRGSLGITSSRDGAIAQGLMAASFICNSRRTRGALVGGVFRRAR